jgi:hypothetical protein
MKMIVQFSRNVGVYVKDVKTGKTYVKALNSNA